MRARITRPDGSVIELTGTPEEIAAYQGPIVNEETFGSFGERDIRRGDEPAEDGPILDPSEPLVIGG